MSSLLLGPKGSQRNFALQTLSGLVIYALFALMQHTEVLLGLVDRQASNKLSAIFLSGALLFFVLVRSGLSTRLGPDPSLTLAQTGFGMLMTAGSYAITGPARGGALALLVLMMAFAMFSLRPQQARRLALFGFGLLASVMLWKSQSDPLRYPPRVELIHAVWAALVLAGLSVLAGRMGTMRERLTAQKHELQRALAHISQLATRDELTGLVNRRHMTSLMNTELERRRNAAAPTTLALLDIDLFKRINDGHGHQAGDLVLKAFAEASVRGLRSSDVLARWGGEEFLLMLPDTTPEQAHQTVERMRQALAEVSFDEIVAGLKVTFSAGLSACSEAEPLDTCIERADQAMYRAKTRGRDCTVMA